MKKNRIPNDIVPCCELCEYASKIYATDELLCKYKNSLKKINEDDVCKNFTFNILAYKPVAHKIQKAFDFTKI